MGCDPVGWLICRDVRCHRAKDLALWLCFLRV